MYVVDHYYHCIQKLTTEGQLLKTFGERGLGKGKFKFPTFIIVDQRDRLIVSDTCNDRLVIMDESGTWLLTINGDVSGCHGFRNPHGLSLDPQGNIHVAANDSIKVFTPEGIYVRSYGDVKEPTGIVIDEEGYSLVTDVKCQCLSIFDPQGKEIHTVYKLVPYGVVLDPKSGSLYVANNGAKTVLKYSV